MFDLVSAKSMKHLGYSKFETLKKAFSRIDSNWLTLKCSVEIFETYSIQGYQNPLILIYIISKINSGV